ncbi:hypothetical protein [Streptomyces sp. PBH53]|uniref:hypothetical protein n=1 Tax=Streptomyces sp. PBH53 TaxID=1577075 RepID=UPI000AA954CF|nr:hypothetical protein [Streptomyces sp. PBH53]
MSTGPVREPLPRRHRGHAQGRPRLDDGQGRVTARARDRATAKARDRATARARDRVTPMAATG